jgi:exodeoxyribonuclease X
MNEAFCVIDLETTDREPKNAHVVEWAALLITPPWFGSGGEHFYTSLVKPPIAIPAETSAIHHITDADVATAPPWEQESQVLAHLVQPEGVIAVAHNANFEREMLAKAGITPHRWLCTYKAAVRVWPDCPSHSNECLRYFLGFGTGRREHQMPHSASHDVQVTADLLQELLRLGTPIADMLQWTLEPALLPRCPIGDWRGHTWDEVEEGFLQWILRKITDREDVRFCAQKELERREAERAKARQPEDDTVPG